MKSRKTLWIVGAAVALLIILTLIFKKGDKISRVNTEMVSKRTITEVVSVNGKIQPESAVKISADVSGEIIQMAVKEGDSVVAGQMLLRINPDLYETQVNQLQANLDNGLASLAGQEAQLESVRAALLQAESNYNRIKKLYEQKVSSEQEYEQARLQYETAKANLSASQKNIQAANPNLRPCFWNYHQLKLRTRRTCRRNCANGRYGNHAYQQSQFYGSRGKCE
jgi:HlyD family secretion protein